MSRVIPHVYHRSRKRLRSTDSTTQTSAVSAEHNTEHNNEHNTESIFKQLEGTTHHRQPTLFASSMLNLAELVALRPDLATLRKVLYFHENQLTYPVQPESEDERDFQFGWNQIMSALVADVILFNSTHNQDSFLNSLDSFVNKMPDFRPKGLAKSISPKCAVVYFPVDISSIPTTLITIATTAPTPSTSVSTTTTTTAASAAAITTPTPITIATPRTITATTTTIPTTTTPRSTAPATQTATSPTTSATSPTPTPTTLTTTPTSKQIIDTVPTPPPTTTTTTAATPPTPTPPLSDVVEQVAATSQQPLHIVWAHRWEHDKDPQTFFETILKLEENSIPFVLSVMGESFTEKPPIFLEVQQKLANRIQHWGFQPSRAEYLRVLQQADVCVSTAIHEFFGVGMVEAVICGCYPLAPNRLSYPELFPCDNLYNTPPQLYKRLRNLCRHPHLVRKLCRNRVQSQSFSSRFCWEALKPAFIDAIHPPE